MYALRTLKLSVYPEVREYNVPRMLTYNAALKNLYVDVIYNQEFGKEMSAQLPCKLNNITITGRALKYLTPYMLIVSIRFRDILNIIFIQIQYNYILIFTGCSCQITKIDNI
jgi:hypothetical protein